MQELPAGAPQQGWGRRPSALPGWQPSPFSSRPSSPRAASGTADALGGGAGGGVTATAGATFGGSAGTGAGAGVTTTGGFAAAAASDGGASECRVASTMPRIATTAAAAPPTTNLFDVVFAPVRAKPIDVCCAGGTSLFGAAGSDVSAIEKPAARVRRSMRSAERREPFGAKLTRPEANCATVPVRLFRSFSRQLRDQVLHSLGNIGAVAGQRSGRRREDRRAELADTVTVEWHLGRSRSSYRMTPSAQMSVRASTSFADAHLLGRHVERRAHDRPSCCVSSSCRRRAVEHLRDAEVEHLHAAASRPRARVRKRFAGLRSRWTMPSACASAMRLAGLEHVVDGLVDRERPVASSDCAEVAALEVLHHHVRRAVRRACRRR